VTAGQKQARFTAVIQLNFKSALNSAIDWQAKKRIRRSTNFFADFGKFDHLISLSVRFLNSIIRFSG
jgi:hypothetical protein